MICLSKSLSGIGLPFSITLIKPDLDRWTPGEHDGTFRGNNLAFVTAAAALDYYWVNDEFIQGIQKREEIVKKTLDKLLESFSTELAVRGRGLIWGIECFNQKFSKIISRECFRQGLIIETAGINDQVLKVLPPLTIRIEELEKGLATVVSTIEKSINEN